MLHQQEKEKAAAECQELREKIVALQDQIRSKEADFKTCELDHLEVLRNLEEKRKTEIEAKVKEQNELLRELESTCQELRDKITFLEEQICSKNEEMLVKESAHQELLQNLKQENQDEIQQKLKENSQTYSEMLLKLESECQTLRIKVEVVESQIDGLEEDKKAVEQKNRELLQKMQEQHDREIQDNSNNAIQNQSELLQRLEADCQMWRDRVALLEEQVRTFEEELRINESKSELLLRNLKEQHLLEIQEKMKALEDQNELLPKLEAKCQSWKDRVASLEEQVQSHKEEMRIQELKSEDLVQNLKEQHQLEIQEKTKALEDQNELLPKLEAKCQSWKDRVASLEEQVQSHKEEMRIQELKSEKLLRNLEEQHQLEIQEKTNALEDQNELLPKLEANWKDKVASLEEKVCSLEEVSKINELKSEEFLRNLKEQHQLEIQEKMKALEDQNELLPKLEAKCQSWKDRVASLEEQVQSHKEEMRIHELKSEELVQNLKEQHQLEIQEKTKTLEDQNELLPKLEADWNDKVASLEEKVRNLEEVSKINELKSEEFLRNLKEQHQLEIQEKMKALEDQNELLPKLEAKCQSWKDRVASLEEQVQSHKEEMRIHELKSEELVQNLKEQHQLEIQEKTKTLEDQNELLPKLEADWNDKVASLEEKVRNLEEVSKINELKSEEFLRNLKEQHQLEIQEKTKALEDQNELLPKLKADCQSWKDRVASLEEQIRGKDEEISTKVSTNNELLHNLKEKKLRMQEKLEKEQNQNDLIRNLEAECRSLKDTVSSLQTQICSKEEELEGKQDEQVEKLNELYQQKIQECNATQQKLQELSATLSEVEKKHAEELESQTSLMTKKDIELHELFSAKTDIEKSLEKRRNALHAAECEKSAQSAHIKELQEKITNFELVLKNDYERSEQVRMLEERPQLSDLEKNFVVVYHQYQQLSVDHGALLLSRPREKSESDDTAEKELQEKLKAEEKKSIELQKSVDSMKLEIEQLKDRLTSSTSKICQLEGKLKTAQLDQCSYTEYTKMKRELSDAKGKLSDVNFKCSELASQYRRSQDDLDKFKYAFQEQTKELEAMKKKFEDGKIKFFEQLGELKEARDMNGDLTTQLAEGRESRAALLTELKENQNEIKNLEQQVSYDVTNALNLTYLSSCDKKSNSKGTF